MKLIVAFLILPALACAAPEKRFFLDSLQGIISLDILKQDVQKMLDVVGSDPTEQACEQEGHKLFGDGLIQHSIPLICHSFQALANHFQLVPDTTPATAGKRFIVDSFQGLISLEVLKQDVQKMLDVLGSDPTEQACEAEASKLLGAGLVQHSITLLCHSFQALVNNFHLVPDTTPATAGKRFIVDSFQGLISLEVLKQDVQKMLDVLGSDPTEQACEAEASKLLGAGLVQHSITLLCHSFQALVNNFHLVPDTTPATAGKRFIVDSFQGLISLEVLKQDVQKMLDVLGSDPTEQACEAEASKLLGAGLVQHSITLLCHSFQALVNNFHLVPDTTPATAGKRFIVDSFQGLISLEVLKQDVQKMLDVLGSDPTEQACEAEASKLLGAGLVQHSITLLCHSFQALVNNFHLVPDTTPATAGKRFIVDSFQGLISLEVLKQDVQKMLDVLGSDPTEQACEAEASKLLGAGLVQHSITLLCHSFQALVNNFHLVPDTTPATAVVGKRFIVDSFQGLISLEVLKQDVQKMLDVLGSDPTEQACEAEASKLLGAGLVQHSITLLCHSFQALVNNFHLVPDTTPATAAVGKRYLLDSLQGIISFDILKQDLQVMLDLLGSDPTEQKCEDEAHKLLGDGLIQHSVVLICHSFQALVNHFQLIPDTTPATV